MVTAPGKFVQLSNLGDCVTVVPIKDGIIAVGRSRGLDDHDLSRFVITRGQRTKVLRAGLQGRSVWAMNCGGGLVAFFLGKNGDKLELEVDLKRNPFVIVKLRER